MSGDFAMRLFVTWLVATLFLSFVLNLPTVWVTGLSLLVLAIAWFVLEVMEQSKAKREAALRAAQERRREREEEERKRREAHPRLTPEEQRELEADLTAMRERLAAREDNPDSTLS